MATKVEKDAEDQSKRTIELATAILLGEPHNDGPSPGVIAPRFPPSPGPGEQHDIDRDDCADVGENEASPEPDEIAVPRDLVRKILRFIKLEDSSSGLRIDARQKRRVFERYIRELVDVQNDWYKEAAKEKPDLERIQQYSHSIQLKLDDVGHARGDIEAFERQLEGLAYDLNELGAEIKGIWRKVEPKGMLGDGISLSSSSSSSPAFGPAVDRYLRDPSDPLLPDLNQRFWGGL